MNGLGLVDLDRDEFHNYRPERIVGVVSIIDAPDMNEVNLKLIALASLHNCTVEFDYHKKSAPQVQTFTPAEVRCSKAANWTGWGWEERQQRPSLFSTNRMSNVRFVAVGVAAQ